MDTKACAAGLELTKTDFWGAKYDIIRKSRQKNHEIGNFVLGHRTSVGSQRWQSHATKLISGIHRGQKAGMLNLNWSKRRSGGQIMRFWGKKWPILAPRAGRYCVTAAVTPVLNCHVTHWNCQNVSKTRFLRCYRLWIGRNGPREAEICVFASKQYHYSTGWGKG